MLLLVAGGLVLAQIRRRRRAVSESRPPHVTASGWTISIKNGISASFFQADGTSRRGADWVAELVKGAATMKVIVRTYPETGDDAGPPPLYLAQAAHARLVELLDAGWDPRTFRLDQTQQLAIVVPAPRRT